MKNNLHQRKHTQFYPLKIAKIQRLTKNVWAIELQIPNELKSIFTFQSGQYIAVQYDYKGVQYINDYSITTAPYEQKIAIAVKVNTEQSSTQAIVTKKVGDSLQVAAPEGRFTLKIKPHEFRTILGFAGGIGITPIISHFKNILKREPRSRLYLFYGNKTSEDIAFRQELHELVEQYGDRLQIFHILSRENQGNQLLFGRINEHKLELIINQILHLDDTDEESTIWDSVDEVLICGKGEMIKTLANACYKNGIPKKNIHFELFESYEEDIYPHEKEFPLIENIQVNFRLHQKDYTTQLAQNKIRILDQLIVQGFPVPYSCKSGICGSCQCKLVEGKVELLENEYLTEKEVNSGHILACMSIALSPKINLNFDEF